MTSLWRKLFPMRAHSMTKSEAVEVEISEIRERVRREMEALNKGVLELMKETMLRVDGAFEQNGGDDGGGK